jgi:anti-sigma B factor antagonist
MTMRLADLTVQHEGQVVVAALEGEIDMSNAAELGQAVGRAVSNQALGLVLDLTDVAYVDSAGIHVIYDLRDRLSVRGQGMRLVVTPQSPIVESLRLAGVLGAVQGAETRAAALRELSGAT